MKPALEISAFIESVLASKTAIVESLTPSSNPEQESGRLALIKVINVPVPVLSSIREGLKMGCFDFIALEIDQAIQRYESACASISPENSIIWNCLNDDLNVFKSIKADLTS